MQSSEGQGEEAVTGNNRKDETPPILRYVPEELLGERVVVRPYREEDARAVYGAIDESREHLFRFLPFATPEYDLAKAECYVREARAKWLLRSDLSLGIWDREDGRYLGGTGLHRIDWAVPHFEIGYWLRVSVEGKGYISETVRLLVRACFETLQANRVEIQCDVRNLRSAAVPRKLGFVHEATLRNVRRDHHGDLVDFYVFAMTPADYQQTGATS